MKTNTSGFINLLNKLMHIRIFFVLSCLFFFLPVIFIIHKIQALCKCKNEWVWTSCETKVCTWIKFIFDSNYSTSQSCFDWCLCMRDSGIFDVLILKKLLETASTFSSPLHHGISVLNDHQCLETSWHVLKTRRHVLLTWC